MKGLFFYILIFFTLSAYAQAPLPHGMVFGKKPDTSIIIEATKAAAFMGKKNRVNTTMRGKVVGVIRQQGGWFELDAGQGKVIVAHFKNYQVTLPHALKGRVVVIEGVAVIPRNGADEQQLNGRRMASRTNTQSSRAVLAFEVNGLMVYK